MICIIACMARNRVIGRNGQLPWRFRADLQHFKAKTNGHTVVMGHKTYENVGKLPGRQCIVLSRNIVGQDAQGTIWLSDIALVLDRKGDIFIAGGAEVYGQFLDIADYMMLTYIHRDIDGDTFFPKFNADNWEVVEARRGNQHSYIEMSRK